MWYGTNSVAEATSGVLTLRVQDGRVGRPTWQPARIQAGGGLPIALSGAAAADAIANWKSLRTCTGLAAGPAA
jgi:poly-gamma-glutamate synthesis protein (capsule biosynthesis protein)